MGNLGIGEWIVIGLCVVMAAFFLIGNWINNERSRRVLIWLKKGLYPFGEIQSAQFRVASANTVVLRVTPAAEAPIQSIEATLTLLRRENLPLWAFQFLRGQRDTLEIHASIPSLPTLDVHIYHQKNVPTVPPPHGTSKTGLALIKSSGEFQVFSHGKPDDAFVERLLELMTPHAGAWLELGLQKTAPQLVAKLRLAPLFKWSPVAFFEEISHLIG